MIDLDNPSTFPTEIKDYVISMASSYKAIVPVDTDFEAWQISNIFKEFFHKNSEYVYEFTKKYESTMFCVWHATRIMDKEQFLKNGIIAISRDYSQNIEKYTKLFQSIGLKESEITPIIEKMEFYWKRDKDSRTETVYFFFPKEFISDPQINIYAINLGGEIVRWAINSLDEDLYKKEPYKRLWILGKPCISKFQCKLEEMWEITQEHLITELIVYFIITELYHLSYDIRCSGFKMGSVPKENVLAVEEIMNYVEQQECFDEYKGFYDELK